MLGRVLVDAGTITERDPDTVRGPDIAFVSRARWDAYPGKPYLGIAPELCVEILSPSNRPGEIKEKAAEYFAAGARLVWIVDPVKEHVTVYRSLADVHLLTKTEQLEGGDVLPGFQLPLAQLFDQSLYGSNSFAPAMTTTSGRSVCSTSIVCPCAASTSGSRR